MNTTFISWAPYCSRSDNIAREFGGSSHMVYWGRLGSHVLTVWLKYLAQWVETLRVLIRERPDVVFVMSPPLVAAFAVYGYCAAAGVPYVIDAHTAAFLHPRWRRLQWLQHWLGRRAETTIVSNDHLAGIIRVNGGHATIITDVPVTFSIAETFRLVDKFTVAVVCSFNYDEPIHEVFKAAEELPEIQFYLTGNPRKLDRTLAEAVPPNVSLTGFLPDSVYGSLLRQVDAVMTLTTRDHTMLRGAYEAIYQGTPVIISEWPLLRQAFPVGAIHVDNSARQMAAAVRRMQADAGRYRAEARELCARKQREWEQVKMALLEQIRTGQPAVETTLASRT